MLLGFALSRRGMGRGVDDLIHAIVIEHNQRAAGRPENGGCILPEYRAWVIDLDALARYQLNREWLEGPERHQWIKDCLEML